MNSIVVLERRKDIIDRQTDHDCIDGSRFVTLSFIFMFRSAAV